MRVKLLHLKRFSLKGRLNITGYNVAADNSWNRNSSNYFVNYRRYWVRRTTEADKNAIFTWKCPQNFIQARSAEIMAFSWHHEENVTSKRKSQKSSSETSVATFLTMEPGLFSGPHTRQLGSTTLPSAAVFAPSVGTSGWEVTENKALVWCHTVNWGFLWFERWQLWSMFIGTYHWKYLIDTCR